ncbi:hypothetical protein, partial [Streptomyces sp. NRRL WC-3725]
DAFAAPEALSPADRAHLDLELSTTLVRVVQALHDVDFSAESSWLRFRPSCAGTRSAMTSWNRPTQ